LDKEEGNFSMPKGMENKMNQLLFHETVSGWLKNEKGELKNDQKIFIAHKTPN